MQNSTVQLDPDTLRRIIMLRELFVQNLALIEDVRVELEPGFCAWTGETGAGKSLLLGAVSLLLGERGSTDLLRSGADDLRITGRFELASEEQKAKVEAVLDATLDEPEILLARRLNRNGRSQAYVNDQPVAVGTLKQIGSLLVDVHGQRETESLLAPDYQLGLLDAFGHLEKHRMKYVDLADQIREKRRRYRELSQEADQRQRELQLIQFEREELDEAGLEPGELEELVKERDRLANAQSLLTFAATGVAQLYEEEDSIVDQLGRLNRQAETWSPLDSRLEDLVQRLDAVSSEISDIAHDLSNLSEKWEADPQRLEEVEQRISLLTRLEKKYGKSVDELVLYRVSIDETETRLSREEDDMTGIVDEITAAYVHLKEAAQELSRHRKRVAKKLATAAQKQLKDLGMPDAKLTASLEPIPWGEDPLTADVPALGAEHLEMVLEANPGEPALPLRRVASGGELSRTMLALKTVLADHDSMGTLIFDEIDSNVGGRLGDVLGQKLAALGKKHQVICVTHLPQVASYAKHHWTIRKRKEGKRTSTTITQLSAEERLEELASMLRGEARGETTRQEAAEMLKTAQKTW